MPDPSALETDAEVAAFLNRVLRLDSFFPEFGPEHARKLFPRSGLFAFGRDQLVVRQGDSGRDLFIVYTGRVTVHKVVGSAAATVATLDSGAVIGEIALLNAAPRTATVTALEDSLIYRLRFEDIQYLLAHHQELANHLKDLADQRLGP